MQDERLAALNAIAAFPNEELMHEFLARHGRNINELLPPYLKMARCAKVALDVDIHAADEQPTK